ncbi:MAG: pirin family protein [Alicyclobacillaceae bacterium]|nr:pirin family protein [Alicyclobacillaceae bacterium]
MGRHPQRVFPTRGLMYPDPFILLDHFAMTKPDGFPNHPHRGFEIISYVLGGAMAHEDSAGNATVIPAGGVQTVTAGRGIIHSEMPAGQETATGLQLWINLPRADKRLDPAYAEFTPQQIPEITQADVTVRTIVGPGSPVTIHRDIRYVDVTIESGSRYAGEIPAGYQGFLYVLEGSGVFALEAARLDGPFEVGEGSVKGIAASKGDLLFLPETSTASSLRAMRAPDSEAAKGAARLGDGALRFVYAAGPPIGEQPIYNGPFVD